MHDLSLQWLFGRPQRRLMKTISIVDGLGDLHMHVVVEGLKCFSVSHPHHLRVLHHRWVSRIEVVTMVSQGWSCIRVVRKGGVITLIGRVEIGLQSGHILSRAFGLCSFVVNSVGQLAHPQTECFQLHSYCGRVHRTRRELGTMSTLTSTLTTTTTTSSALFSR